MTKPERRYSFGQWLYVTCCVALAGIAGLFLFAAAFSRVCDHPNATPPETCTSMHSAIFEPTTLVILGLLAYAVALVYFWATRRRVMSIRLAQIGLVLASIASIVESFAILILPDGASSSYPERLGYLVVGLLPPAALFLLTKYKDQLINAHLDSKPKQTARPTLSYIYLLFISVILLMSGGSLIDWYSDGSLYAAFSLLFTLVTFLLSLLSLGTWFANNRLASVRYTRWNLGIIFTGIVASFVYFLLAATDKQVIIDWYLTYPVLVLMPIIAPLIPAFFIHRYQRHILED